MFFHNELSAGFILFNLFMCLNCMCARFLYMLIFNGGFIFLRLFDLVYVLLSHLMSFSHLLLPRNCTESDFNASLISVGLVGD